MTTSASGLSRRTILIGCVAGGAGALATVASALEMSPVKVSKDSVHYVSFATGDHRCGECKLFVKPSSCIAVAATSDATAAAGSGCRAV